MGIRDIPVADGPYFCSPRCGCRCTKKAYEQACKEASALATFLGPGWASMVWENTGWCYCAVVPDSPFRVSPNRVFTGDGLWKVESYTVYVNSNPQIVCASNPDLVACMREALAGVRAVHDHMARVLEQLQELTRRFD